MWQLLQNYKKINGDTQPKSRRKYDNISKSPYFENVHGSFL